MELFGFKYLSFPLCVTDACEEGLYGTFTQYACVTGVI
jgi:hypothetical protein